MSTPFPDAWHSGRRRLVRDSMRQLGIDCLILSNSSSPVNLFYLTGYMSVPHKTLTLAFFAANGQSALLVPALRADQAAEQCACISAQFRYTDRDNLLRLLKEIGGQLGLKPKSTFALEDSIEFHKLICLRDAFPDAHFQQASQLLEPIQICKTPEELQLLREAHQKTDEVYGAALKQVYQGMREIDFRRILEREFYARGFDGGFLNGVAFGKNTAYAQWTAGQQPISNGMPAYCDLGAVFNHYWTDMTRCFSLGTPPDGYQKLYDICLEGQQRAEQSVRAGRTFHEVHWAAGTYFRQKGVLEYWPVRIGHGVGLLANEAPSVCDGNDQELKKNMVITIEPTLHIPGQFGVRVENTVIVTETGCEPLSRYPLELQILER